MLTREPVESDHQNVVTMKPEHIGDNVMSFATLTITACKDEENSNRVTFGFNVQNTEQENDPDADRPYIMIRRAVDLLLSEMEAFDKKEDQAEAKAE